jgi:hypothetical protein
MLMSINSYRVVLPRPRSFHKITKAPRAAWTHASASLRNQGLVGLITHEQGSGWELLLYKSKQQRHPMAMGKTGQNLQDQKPGALPKLHSQSWKVLMGNKKKH